MRCDRGEPCHNCEVRKIECKYAPIPRGRVAVQRQEENRNELEGRIRHLEKLIGSLAQQSSNGGGSVTNGTPSPSTTGGQGGQSTGLTGTNASPLPSDRSEVKSGRLIEDDKQMVYVSPDHWAAIHDEVR